VCGGGGGVVGGVGRRVGVGVRGVLARPRRVDSREVDIGVDCTQSDTQPDQHEQDDKTDEHRSTALSTVVSRHRSPADS